MAPEPHRPVLQVDYSEWNGATALQEILAAFVMPNHPAVAPLVRQA